MNRLKRCVLHWQLSLAASQVLCRTTANRNFERNHASCVLQAQVQHMTKKHHIYMTLDGRISMAGLSGSSCKYLADAIKDAVENIKS